MKSIITRGVAHDGILSVKVPEELNEKELEVRLVSINNKDNDLIEEQIKKHEEKVKRLMSIVGTVKYPDFPMSKYDVYDQ